MLDPSFWAGRQVLLTGHTGFNGSWLLLWLQQLGAEVWGYALEPEPEPSMFRQLECSSPPGRNWNHKVGDLSDRASLAELVQRSQPEMVLHLAAQPLIRQSYVDPLGTWATNLMGSLNVLEALKQLTHLCRW